MDKMYTKKVLVIDDEQTVLNELCDMLGKNGFETTPCLSADDALQAALDDTFDLIISDINLGMESGLELCQKIHRIDTCHETPVIFLSGAQIPDIIRRSHVAGGTYYVRKPFDPSVMAELVDKAMWMPHILHAHITPRQTAEFV
ncbi:MAG: response regulator [Planctomycetaceae bacterium]|nr:response regulator [Planctomycetaceae bacterium]